MNDRRPLDVVKAVKLVYLADRESVLRSGFPIQDEVRVSMPLGPVNSSTYSYINGEGNRAETGWSEFLNDRSDHRIGLINNDLSVNELDELSEAEIEALDAVWEKFGSYNKWDLVDWTHNADNVPEWEDPGRSSVEIPLERLMRALGIDNAVMQAELVKSLTYSKGIINRL
ncbi:MAG: Panacea domain-containing protein [Pikeienuella sp.]